AHAKANLRTIVSARAFRCIGKARLALGDPRGAVQWLEKGLAPAAGLKMGPAGRARGAHLLAPALWEAGDGRPPAPKRLRAAPPAEAPPRGPAARRPGHAGPHRRRPGPLDYVGGRGVERMSGRSRALSSSSRRRRAARRSVRVTMPTSLSPSTTAIRPTPACA